MGSNSGAPGAYIQGVWFGVQTLTRLFGPTIAQRLVRSSMMYIERYDAATADYIYGIIDSLGLNTVLNPHVAGDFYSRVHVKREANRTLELDTTSSSPAKAPRLNLPAPSTPATSSSSSTSLRNALSKTSMSQATPSRRQSSMPLKVIQTVAAPSSKRSYSRRRGSTGITFDLARIMYPVLHTSASRGNLLMGIKCLTQQTKTSSDNHSSFVSTGAAWQANGNSGQDQWIAALTYLWGTGLGRGLTATSNTVMEPKDVSGQANEFVVNFGLLRMIGVNFMPIPTYTVAGDQAPQPNSGNQKRQAPYLEIYGRSWFSDCFQSNNAMKSPVIYPDFKFCAQGCQMREYPAAPSDSDFNKLPNSLQSYAGLQGVLELDGFLSGNQICMLSQMAYDNSTLGRRLEGPSTFYVDRSITGTITRVFDNNAINDAAQAVWLQNQQSVYHEDNFWKGSRSVGGKDLPFMYDLKDTLHFSNSMDVPIVVNVEIFECSDNIEHRTPQNADAVLGFNEHVDIMPLWQQSLNDKSDSSANNNGFYNGMSSFVADTVRSERIYDVGRSADGAKFVKKYWKCIGKKHFKLESLQEVSHTFHKYDVINMKNVVDHVSEGFEKGTFDPQLPVMNLATPTKTFIESLATAPDNKEVGAVLVSGHEKNKETGAKHTSSDILTHVDHRIKKYVKGHSYKYIITWFGLKQMANDSDGIVPDTANPPYNDGGLTDGTKTKLSNFPDSGYIRNGRAQLIVSRSVDAQMRVGPQCKKSLFQEQRFGPIGESTGCYSTAIDLDKDLTGGGFTRAAATPNKIAPITRQRNAPPL